jgi:hypothetical protein
MPGYEDAGARAKQFTLIEGLHFDLLGGSPGVAKLTAPAMGTGALGGNDVAQYLPDGTLDPSSRSSIRLVDRSNSAIEVAQMKDASGYEIVKDAP